MGLYASTPPLEALRWLLSEAATVGPGEEEEKVILLPDVSRAFFEAPVRRKVAVRLPEEAITKEERDRGTVGILKMSLYGTRDTAAKFQVDVAKAMKEACFEQATFNASLFYNPSTNTRTLVLGL